MIFSSEKNKKKAIRALISLAIIITIIFFLGKPLWSFFEDTEKIRNAVLDMGAFGPAAIILMQAIQVIIAPIPGQIAGIATGFIYGTLWGTVLTMIGTMIGSFIAIIISRKFGRPFIEKIIDKKTLGKADKLVDKKGPVTFFIIWLLPMLPDDAVCFLAGLTKIRMHHLMFLVFLGRLPGFVILNAIGAGFAESDSIRAIFLFVALMILATITFIFREKIEYFIEKIIEK